MKMGAYYKKIEAPINDEIGMVLYVVYYEAVRGDGCTCASVYKPIGIYDKEDIAKAVVNAVKEGLI